MKRLVTLVALTLIATLSATAPAQAAPDPSDSSVSSSEESTSSAPLTATPELADARAAKAGRTLIVKVRQPKKVGKPRIVVRGPKGYRKVVRKSTKLRGLAKGTYRIKAPKVRSKKYDATATVSKKRIKLTKRKKARVRVDYGTIVSRKVKPLPPKAVQGYTPSADGLSGTLRSKKKLKKGDIVAVGIGAKTPHGLLSKVTGNIGKPSKKVYRVQQVRIQEAVPRGSFSASVRMPLSPPPSNRSERAAARRAPKFDVTCTASLEAGIEVEAGGGVDVDFDGDWDWADSSLTVSADASASASARAWLHGAGKCELEDVLFFKKMFAPITVTVGPVPIVILPKLDMYIGGSISAEGYVEVSGEVGIKTGIEVTGNRKGISPKVTGPTFTRKAELEAEAKAQIDAYAKAVLTGELYGIAGPHLSIKVGVEGNADTSKNPWWWVDAYVKAGAGIAVDKCVNLWLAKPCIQFDQSKDDILTKEIRIVDANTF